MNKKARVTVADELKGDVDLRQLGLAIGQGMAAEQAARAHGKRPLSTLEFKESYEDITDIGASIYGRHSLFDPCSPGDIWGLQVQTIGLMNWLGMRPNRFYQRRVDVIPWIGPAGTIAGTATTGAGNPCSDPTGWEFGVCGWFQTHSSWYHRMSDGLNPHTIVQDRCETSPRYRINGKQISDDVEWQAQGIMQVLMQDIRRDLIHGNHDNAFQMDGLEAIIKTGYTNDDGTTCPYVDSILVDWAHDNLDGDVNGLGNFFEYLDEVITEIEYRASGIGTIAESDMVLLTSRFMATCLLDSYACYTTCGVTSTNDVTDQALRAQQRQLRRDLNGGPLYDGSTAVGFITLKSGRRIPILVDDALDIDKMGATYCTDMYLLTRRIAGLDVLYGEYLDLREYENRVKTQMPSFSVRVDAGGRFVYKGKEDNWCINLQVGTSPEIYLSAPWAQARISNVCCARMRTPLTGDPYQPFYVPGGQPLHQAVQDYPQGGYPTR